MHMHRYGISAQLLFWALVFKLGKVLKYVCSEYFNRGSWLAENISVVLFFSAEQQSAFLKANFQSL